MEQAIKNLVKNIAQKMGKKWDISAQLISSEIYGPTVRKVQEKHTHILGEYFIAAGMLHSAHRGEKVIFTVSVPKDDTEEYIQDWIQIEISGLSWDPDCFRHDSPMYSFPEAKTGNSRENFEDVLKVTNAAPKIIKDFEKILGEVKASEHAKNMKKLGL